MQSLESKSSRLRLVAYGLAFVSGAAAMHVAGGVFAGTNQDVGSGTDSSTHSPSAPLFVEVPVQLAASKEEPIADASNDDLIEKPATLIPASNSFEFNGELRVQGKTEPAFGKFAKVPLATSEAVAFVDVKPGAVVKKGWQLFSHWESPERLQAAKAELTKAKGLIEVATLRASLAKQSAQRVRNLGANIVAEEEIEQIETNLNIREKEVETAKLQVEELERRFAALQFDFDQAFVVSPIDGIVTTVNVVPGERRWTTSEFRGVTILDPSVLECRCQLSSTQLSQLRELCDLAAGQLSAQSDPEQTRQATYDAIDVKVQGYDRTWNAKLVAIGIQADGQGALPVSLEVPNPTGDLVCGVTVEVVFRAASTY